MKRSKFRNEKGWYALALTRPGREKAMEGRPLKRLPAEADPSVRCEHGFFPAGGSCYADWWTSEMIARKTRLIAEQEWTAERIRYAMLVLRDCVEVDPDRRGGIPVLRGTRFTVAQMFAELAEGRSLAEIAAAFRLDEAKMRQILESFAICLDRSAFE